jgi:hypothetical protein
MTPDPSPARLTIIFALCALIGTGCSPRQTVKTSSLGGPYYQETIIIPCKGWYLMEPGNCDVVRYIHVTSGTTNEITRYLGGFGDSICKQFDYRIYGSNFVYVEREGGDWSKFRLRDYSAKTGNVTVDDGFGKYWKVIADDHGITCHRYQNGQQQDDPQPVFYSAEYLSGL